jgi:prephenate dehydratase
MRVVSEGAVARELVPRVRVAFQGTRGAYSDEAIEAYWRGGAEPVPARDCAEVARLVVAGEVDFGLLPLENTLAGSVTAAYDALLSDGVTIVGEVVLPIHHCLVGHPNAHPETLLAIASHPVALAQCRAFFGRHPHIEARAASDTAGAAKAVAERGDRRVAAIASRGAARRYGLAVLADGIEDREDNQTRFVAIARTGDAAAAPALAAGAPARTALMVSLLDRPAALLELLRPFADQGLNVGVPVVRPTGDPWKYWLVLEVEHPAGDPGLDVAIDAVRAAGMWVRVLGTFAEVARGGARRDLAAAHAGAHPGARG